MQPTFDFKRFLSAHFRDADGLIAAVGKHFRKTPTREAVKKWFRRATVSSEWFPAVIASAEAEYGEPLDLNEYFEGENHDEDIFA